MRISQLLIVSLMLGSVVGYIFSTLGVPLPWMLGPLAVTMNFSLLAGQVKAPLPMRWAGQFIVATAVALNLTGDMLDIILASFLWMVLSAFLILTAAVLGARWLSGSGKIDRATAAFSLLPGGAVEMAGLATRFGGDGAFVALTQTLRIASIVVFVPFLMIALGSPVLNPAGQTQYFSLPAIVLIALAGILPTLVMFRFRLANAFFVGPLAGVGLYALSGLPGSDIPALLLIAAQIMLGVSLGSMFDRTAFLRLGRIAPYTIAISIALVVTGLIIGFGFSLIGVGATGPMLLANAPGSVAEMAIVARSSGFEPSLIAAYHLTRIFIIVPFAPLLFRLV